MSKWEAKSKARDASEKLFGVEDTITMGVSDARYRYYQWLRSWYGMGEKLVTHKCPFYQFMFWGSLLMVVTFPLFIFAYIIYGLTKLIGLVIPSLPEHFEALKDENPFSFSLIISMLAFITTFFISLLFLDNAVAWVGYGIHVIFAIPYFVVYWVLWAVFWFLSVVWDLLVMLAGWLVAIEWGMLGYVVGMGLLILLGMVVTFWVLYRIGVFLFNRGCFNFLIKKSCNIRERRQDKKFARLAERRKKEAEFKKQQDEYYKAHKEEIDAKEERRKETAEKWINTIVAILKPVGLVFGFIFSVIGVVFTTIWWVLKKIGEICYVVWHMITSTVSNHCPPIEFIETHEDVGELVLRFQNESHNGFIDGEKRKIYIGSDVFPEKFKLRTKQSDYKKVRISYNLVATNPSDYEGRYHIHSINEIKYLPKPRKPRTKKVKTDGEK